MTVNTQRLSKIEKHKFWTGHIKNYSKSGTKKNSAGSMI